MTSVHQHRGILSFVYIPLIAAIFLFGIFSLVWLRSSIRAMEYSIAALDEQRMEILKERKALMAEKASILSIQNVEHKTGEKLGLVFPDRVKVVYVKKGNTMPYRASLEGRYQSEP